MESLELRFRGLDVAPSRICLGGCDFGTTIPKDQAFRILDLYVKMGGNFLDTAHVYSSWVPGGEGLSERIIGEWLGSREVRSSIILGTKGAHPPLDNMAKGRCSREDIRRDLAESLERLRTDSIDLYWLHRDEPERPVGEIIETMAELVREGLITTYGASNWPWQRIEEANRYASERGLPCFAANQPGWAWAERPSAPPGMRMLFMDPKTRTFHERTGLPVVPYSSQAKGFFGEENVHWAKEGFNGNPPRAAVYDTQANRERLLRAIELAGQKGCTPNQIALAYLLCQPFPVYPIISTGNPEHLEEAIEALSLFTCQTQTGN